MNSRIVSLFCVVALMIVLPGFASVALGGETHNFTIGKVVAGNPASTIAFFSHLCTELEDLHGVDLASGRSIEREQRRSKLNASKERRMRWADSIALHLVDAMRVPRSIRDKLDSCQAADMMPGFSILTLGQHLLGASNETTTLEFKPRFSESEKRAIKEEVDMLEKELEGRIESSKIKKYAFDYLLEDLRDLKQIRDLLRLQ